MLAATAELLGEVSFAGISVEADLGPLGRGPHHHLPALARPATLMADALEASSSPCPEPDTGTLRGDLTVILRELAATLVARRPPGCCRR